MSDTKKMTKEEIARMVEGQSTLRRCREIISDAELLIHTTNQRKQGALNLYDQTTRELDAFTVQIKEKYGDVHIDFKTGELVKRK